MDIANLLQNWNILCYIVLTAFLVSLFIIILPQSLWLLISYRHVLCSCYAVTTGWPAVTAGSQVISCGTSACQCAVTIGSAIYTSVGIAERRAWRRREHQSTGCAKGSSSTTSAPSVRPSRGRPSHRPVTSLRHRRAFESWVSFRPESEVAATHSGVHVRCLAWRRMPS